MIIDKIKIGNTTYNVGARYQDVSGTPTKLSDFTNDEGFIDKSVNNLDNYTPSSQTTTRLELVLDSSTFELKGILKDSSNNVIYTSNEIDLPLETVVVDGTYDSLTKEIVLELVNGNTIRFSVSALVSGLISDTDLATALENYYTKGQVDNLLNAKQNTITSSNKLDSDLVDDTNSTNKFVTSAEKNAWNGKQDELTAGENITIVNNVISALGGGSSLPEGTLPVYSINASNYNSNVSAFNFGDKPAGLYIINTKSTSFTTFHYKYRSTFSINTLTTARNGINFFYIPEKIGETYEGNRYVYIVFTYSSNVGLGIKQGNIYETSSSEASPSILGHFLTTSAQTIQGAKTFSTAPISSNAPTTNNQLTNKAYVDSVPTTYAGYDATKTQVLKNVNGTLTWVDEV